MFSRFKEKLSGFKEALSSKIAEKVSLAEKLAGKKDEMPGDEGNRQPGQGISPFSRQK